MQAMHYLYKTLPANMKHVLRATAAAEGLDPNKTENVYQLLAMAVSEHTSHEVERNTDIKLDASATKREMGESKGGKTIEMSGLESIAMGSGTTPVLTTIALSNSLVVAILFRAMISSDISPEVPALLSIPATVKPPLTELITFIHEKI